MKGPDAFVAIVHSIGVPAPFFMAWLTILIELFGGLAVLLGAFVVPLSLPMAGVLLVALFTVHLPFGFTSIKLLAITPVRTSVRSTWLRNEPPLPGMLGHAGHGGSGPLAVDNMIAKWLPKIWKRPGGSESAREGEGRPARQMSRQPSLDLNRTSSSARYRACGSLPPTVIRDWAESPKRPRAGCPSESTTNWHAWREIRKRR